MKTVSLLAVAGYLPEKVVGTDFFAPGTERRRGMFTAPKLRRHITPGESAADLIERASLKLIDRANVDRRDVDLLFTNVAVPDQAFTGCGAEVAHRLGLKPQLIVDLHNSGCVSFIYMLELARALIDSTAAKCALLACVQDAAGRVFAQPELRKTSPAPVPGDGCGVGLVAASALSPVVSVVHQIQGEFAPDMEAWASDGRRYWEPGTSPITLRFTDEHVASIIARGNRMVPEIVAAACDRAAITPREIDLLITNQPNATFLRNWREALELPVEKHHDTFDRYGNLFGAAVPINLEDALQQGKLRRGDLLALGGFAHAGDYSAAAVIRW